MSASDYLSEEPAARRPFQRGRPQAPLVARDTATLVAFTVGGDLMASPVEGVERVLRYTTPSPNCDFPDWLEGAIEHRRRMVPVIDLRIRLQRNRTEPDAATRIIVFNTGPDWLAAIVDSVKEVVVVDATSIVAPPAQDSGRSVQYLRGVLTHKGQTVLVLDVSRVLTSHELLSVHDLSLTV